MSRGGSLRFATEDVGNADPQALTVVPWRPRDGRPFQSGRPEVHNTALVAGGAVSRHRARREQRRCISRTVPPAEAAERDAAEPVPLHLSAHAPTKLIETARLRQGLTLPRTDEPDAVAEMD
jgi:replication-associated recombination protein RarA